MKSQTYIALSILKLRQISTREFFTAMWGDRVELPDLEKETAARLFLSRLAAKGLCAQYSGKWQLTNHGRQLLVRTAIDA